MHMSIREQSSVSAKMYVYLFCIFWGQGVLYPSSSHISQLCIALIILFSLYYSFQCLKKSKINFYIILTALLLALFAICGIISYILDGHVIEGVNNYKIPLINWFKYSFFSLLPIISFYHLSHSNTIEIAFIRKNYLILFAAGVMAYVNCHNVTANVILNATGEVKESLTNNAGYFILSFTPLLCLVESSLLKKYSVLVLITILIFLSAKRGAICIYSIVLLLLVLNDIKNSTSYKKLLLAGSVIIITYVIYVHFSIIANETPYVIRRLESMMNGDSSGRGNMYASLIDSFLYDVTTAEFFFGAGPWATLKYHGIEAHNDWLEIAIDMGVIGLVFFSLYWISFIYNIFFRKQSSKFTFPLLLIFIISFLKTMFSMSIMNIPFYEAITIGLCLGFMDQKQAHSSL